MSDHSERDAIHAEIAKRLRDARKASAPAFLCACGEPAVFEVNHHGRVELYCPGCLPADALR